MKTIAITTVAWVATIRSFVDGDIFRESNIDLSMGDVADRLGYLKNQSDLSPRLAGDQTFTGSNTFDTGVTAEDFIVTGDGIATFNVQTEFATTVNFADVTDFDEAATFNAPIIMQGGVVTDRTTLADANATIASDVYEVRVPTLTGNRVYTLPTPAAVGQRIRISRPRTADAFTATLQTAGAIVIGQISSSAVGWLEAYASGAGAETWVLSAWGGSVVTLLATV